MLCLLPVHHATPPFASSSSSLYHRPLDHALFNPGAHLTLFVAPTAHAVGPWRGLKLPSPSRLKPLHLRPRSLAPLITPISLGIDGPRPPRPTAPQPASLCPRSCRRPHAPSSLSTQSLVDPRSRPSTEHPPPRPPTSSHTPPPPHLTQAGLKKVRKMHLRFGKRRSQTSSSSSSFEGTVWVAPVLSFLR